HPSKENTKNKVWLYEGKNKVITEMTRSGVLQLVGRISGYANLNKKVNCHDFRHTSISKDRKNGVPQSIIEQKHGLTHGSKMMGVYDHTGDTEYEKYILNKAKNTPETYSTLKQENQRMKNEYEDRIKTLEESKLNFNSTEIQKIIDNKFSTWLGTYNSSELCISSHIWESKGTYEIRVKAMDHHGAESNWSDSLIVSMPHSYNPFQLLINRLINRFPILEPILSK
ncbi:unnamed protein product, partial [marine sediment metagenome]